MPTFEECMQEAYEEYVRGWLDEHSPMAHMLSPVADLSPDVVVAVQSRIGDAEAAIERLIGGASDPVEARRAIDAALQAIYRAHNGLRDRPGYWDRAGASVEGCTLQAVVYVRGRMEHEVLVEAHESEVLVPTPTMLTSEDLYPGINYYWLIWDEIAPHMTPSPGARDKRALVEEHLAGRLVVQGLRRSVRHLLAELPLS